MVERSAQVTPAHGLSHAVGGRGGGGEGVGGGGEGASGGGRSGGGGVEGGSGGLGTQHPSQSQPSKARAEHGFAESCSQVWLAMGQ